MVENPFFHRGPIKQRVYFFGRERETTRALQMLKNGQSISVIGPRKIGKTSLLLHLADPQVYTGHGLDSAHYLFAYIDCEILGELEQPDIYRTMLEEIGERAVAIGAGSYLKEMDQEDLPFHQFRRVIREITGQGLRLIYLFDEFECLGRNHRLGESFFSSLRSLILHNVAYVTGSQEPLLELTFRGDVLSSPFFNIFDQLPLGLFSIEEANQLVYGLLQTAGIQFPQEVVDFVWDLVGPHPFYLQLACYYAFELATLGRGFDEQDYQLVEGRVLSDLADHFCYYLNRLDEEKKRALVHLSQAGASELPFEIGQELKRQCLVVEQNGEYKCLSRAFEGFVTRKLATSWDAAIAEGDRRLATVLFADLVDFTPLAERHKPEEIMGIMKRVTKLFGDSVERHGGTVIQFRGDGILALFGVPAEQEDDAMRAVRASLDIQRGLEEFSQLMVAERGLSLSARIGLNTGVIVVGEMGSEQHTEPTVLGDAVNLAERMQRVAQPGGIVISESTYQQIRSLFKVQALGPVPIKGKTREVKIYRVISEH
ncbi:MAG: adenylate/guanylate cyclase domain-containing protein [Chloroflexota bacterium]